MPAKPAPKKNKSAIKRSRQSEARAAKNRSVRSMLKTMTKKVEQEASAKSAEGAKAALNKAVSAIDKAAIKGIIHKNTASRNISRLTRLVNSTLPSEGA